MIGLPDPTVGDPAKGTGNPLPAGEPAAMPAAEVDSPKAEAEYSLKQYGTWERFSRPDNCFRYESGEGVKLSLSLAQMQELASQGHSTGLLARDALRMWGEG